MKETLYEELFDCMQQRISGFYTWIFAMMIDERGRSHYPLVDRGTRRYMEGRMKEALRHAETALDEAQGLEQNEYLQELARFCREAEKVGDFSLNEEENEGAALYASYSDALSDYLKNLDIASEKLSKASTVDIYKDFTYLHKIEKKALYHLVRHNLSDSYRCYLHLKIKWAQTKRRYLDRLN